VAKKYRHIGRSTPRQDARAIVTGQAQFIDDTKLPGMLYGTIMGSPHPHATILKIDTHRALALPGVKAILTHRNIPEWKVGIPAHRLVLDSQLRFVGDAVALVAAETPDIAADAVDLIDVKYAPLPAVFDTAAALRPDSPQLYPDFPGNLIPIGTYLDGPTALQRLVTGDPTRGFAEADFTVEGACAYDNIANPLPPEPPGVIADWEGDARLTVWVSSQSSSLNQPLLQGLFQPAEVRIIGAQCGGSYGTKNGNLLIILQAALMARTAGHPVKLYYTKEQHFNLFSLRMGSRISARIGLKKDGTVTAISGQWLVDTGAASETAPLQVHVGLGEAQLIARCQNWDLQPFLVCTNRNPSGVVRGFGGQELKSALLPVINLGLEQAGIDPLDFFKKNFIRTGDGFYWRDGKWTVCRGPDYSRAMQKGAQAFGWQSKWKGWGKPTAVHGNRLRGVGVGIHGNADVGEDESEVLVRLESDGRAIIEANISESGMGQRSSLCKMAAEILNLPVDRVSLIPPDTRISQLGQPLFGSRGTYIIGAAVIQAARDARRRLFDSAASALNVPPAALETADGQIYVTGKKQPPVPWREALGSHNSLAGRGRCAHDFSLPNFMLMFAEVEVDTGTGMVDLVRIVAVTDCGQIIDPPSLQGQLHGALGSAGIDTAIFEESILDRKTGRILNCNMIDYKWRTFNDLPDFRTVVLETPFPSHVFHAIGVGEIATAPGPSAVMMAFYNATGRRIMSYPLTPDRVLQALSNFRRLVQ
jgi:CO/xanthine dehydrogenase Mo-binding subunit